MGRSILELTFDELQKVIETKKLPEGVDLAGLEQRPDFKKLFSQRMSPDAIARALVKDKAKGRGTPPPQKEFVDTTDLRKQRLELKEKELKLKEERLTTQTQLYRQIYEKMNKLESKLDRILDILEKGGKNV